MSLSSENVIPGNHRVLFGANAKDDKNRKEIINACQKKGIPIFHAYKDSFEFKVKRRPIE